MAHRFDGKNLDEALGTAAASLNVPRYQLKYKVLSEKRGFLGGVKRIAIEVDVDPDAIDPATTAIPIIERTPSEPREERSPRAGDRPRGRTRREDGGRSRGRGERERRPRFEEVETPEQEERSPLATRVADWMNELAALSDFDVEVRTVERDQQLLVNLFGRDAWRFADRDGELLDAVQTILGRAFRDVEKSIDLDAMSFKERRNSEIVERAKKLADRVRAEGMEQLLPAMSPAERRVVHMALADDPDVMTESRGEGYLKRVTILPRPFAEA